MNAMILVEYPTMNCQAIKYLMSKKLSKMMSIFWILCILNETFFVQCNLVTAPIQECHSLCRCLEKGSIMMCRSAGLHHIPEPLPTTMFLDFDHNHVTMLHNSSFFSTPRLEMLSFQDNQIQKVEAGALIGLSNLHTLLLRKNLLASLPADLFWSTPLLEVIDLSENLFINIPDQLFQPLHSLRILNMSYNHLDSPHLGRGFSYTKQLQLVDLSGNNFVSLEQKAFRVIRNWDSEVPHSMNLSYCGVRHIHPQTMKNLLYLNTLSLAGNPNIDYADLQASIEDLSTSSLRSIKLSGINISDIYMFFRNFQHADLHELDLSYNKIQTIQRGTFFYITELQFLDLSHNKIRSIQDFSSLNKLIRLDLSFNELHFIDPVSLESLHSLQNLDISNNALTQLDDEPFMDLFDLRVLDISSNKISRVMFSGGMESLHTLIARDNILSDLSFVSQLRHLQILDISRNVITQLGPNFLPREQHLLNINFSSNAIHHIDPHAFQDSTQVVVDFSFNRLSSLSFMGLSHIQKLYLNHNMLYNVTSDAFSTLDSLKELYLGHNQLVALSHGTFKDLRSLQVLDLGENPIGPFLTYQETPESTSLIHLDQLKKLILADIDLHQLSDQLLMNLSTVEVLDLSMNYLRIVSTDTFIHMKHLKNLKLSHNLIKILDPKVFQDLRNLHNLDISGNPFDCTCDLMPFRTWAVSTLSQVSDLTINGLYDTVQYQCISPPEWKGVPLLNFQLDSTSCSTKERAVLLVAMACIVLALTLMIVVGVLRYKWWRRRKTNRGPTIVQEYTFVDDSSTAALTGNQTLSMNSTTQHIKEWV